MERILDYLGNFCCERSSSKIIILGVTGRNTTGITIHGSEVMLFPFPWTNTWPWALSALRLFLFLQPLHRRWLSSCPFKFCLGSLDLPISAVLFYTPNRYLTPSITCINSTDWITSRGRRHVASGYASSTYAEFDTHIPTYRYLTT